MDFGRGFGSLRQPASQTNPRKVGFSVTCRGAAQIELTAKLLDIVLRPGSNVYPDVRRSIMLERHPLQVLVQRDAPAYFLFHPVQVLVRHMAAIDLEVTSHVDAINIALAGDQN
jgi:hypothetical protein